jgi:hypothetical protein
MAILLRKILPGRIGQELAVPLLPVGGIREHPQVAHFVHAADLGMQESDQAAEAGLDDGGAFLLVGRKPAPAPCRDAARR